MLFRSLTYISHCLSGQNDVRQAGVTGVVTDESGEPLIGVTVLVKGGSQGSVTDLEGKFTLVANVGDVLQFSYIGYVSQEVKLKDLKLLRVVLREDANLLDEVVVIGYGSMKKKDLTGAITHVQAEKMAKEKPATMQDLFQKDHPERSYRSEQSMARFHLSESDVHALTFYHRL